MEPPAKALKLDNASIYALLDENLMEDSCLSQGSSSGLEQDSYSDSSENSEMFEEILPIRKAESNSTLDSCFECLISKELDEEISLNPDDPLGKLTGKLMVEIFQHLAVDEIKSAMCVSKFWNYKLTNCEELMTKRFVLNVEVDSPNFCCSDLLSLLKSRRIYPNVSISMDNNREITKIIEFVLKKFAPSITNLKIVKLGGYNSMLMKPLSFDKLTQLELSIVCGRLNCPLEHICTLRKLTVNGLDPNALLSCLQHNPFLEELVLYENAFTSYFEQDISHELPFNLTKFGIFDHINTELVLDGEFPTETWDCKARINFLKFLKTQELSLTSLHMDSCFAEDLGKVVKMFPALECLELNKLIGDTSKLRLAENSSITTLIGTKFPDQLITAIVTSFKKLKSMFIDTLKTHQFFYIVRNAEELEHFCYFWASKTETFHGSCVLLESIYRPDLFESSRANIKIEFMRKTDFLKMIEKKKTLRKV